MCAKKETIEKVKSKKKENREKVKEQESEDLTKNKKIKTKKLKFPSLYFYDRFYLCYRFYSKLTEVSV